MKSLQDFFLKTFAGIVLWITETLFQNEVYYVFLKFLRLPSPLNLVKKTYTTLGCKPASYSVIGFSRVAEQSRHFRDAKSFHLNRADHFIFDLDLVARVKELPTTTKQFVVNRFWRVVKTSP